MHLACAHTHRRTVAREGKTEGEMGGGGGREGGGGESGEERRALSVASRV